ncbi:MAG TPA: MoxR family ATPase [Streptosporangiaceae bacterium]|nr:MoxR family ATPase [Streptosporangiaceae bacterium]
MAARGLRYRRIFDPAQRPGAAGDGPLVTGFGDRRSAVDYVYTEQITLAVNVALATARPLLVRGPAGSGKSSLAADIAARMGWDFLAEVISSRTQARDLLWTFDAVQRLRDAQAQLPVSDAAAYVRPGILWYALDPEGAAARAENPHSRHRDGAVVLLDEIDKADPDTPNDLLVPLGSGTFYVTELKLDVTLQRPLRPLVVITTNDERELPKAFVRRCIVLDLPDPEMSWLVKVATNHFGPAEQALYRRVARFVIEVRERAVAEGARPPSTAEFLDALQACQHLEIRPGSTAWSKVAVSTLEKWVRAGKSS